MSNKRRAELSTLLQSLYSRYNDRKFLREDPVCFVHRYSDPRDQEVAGLISALLSFGNVKAIQGSVGGVLEVMGAHPSRYLEAFDPVRETGRLGNLGHRWVRGGDLLILMVLLREILRRYGSLKDCFLEDYRDSDPHIGPMLDRFSNKVLSMAEGHGRQAPLSRGFRYFFPSPRDGSPCKRLCMFLRWMVRPSDGVDLGLWTGIPPSRLVIPLDVHVYRFAHRFHLTPYKTPQWDVAVQVTDFLRTLDVSDPVKFDFPICHYGMDIGW